MHLFCMSSTDDFINQDYTILFSSIYCIMKNKFTMVNFVNNHIINIIFSSDISPFDIYFSWALTSNITLSYSKLRLLY